MRNKTWQYINQKVSSSFDSILTGIMRRARSIRIKAYQKRGISHSGIRYNHKAYMRKYA